MSEAGKGAAVEAVIFDLDGTLADTLEAIAASGNHMLRTLGLPEQPRQRYRFLAGQGVERLVRDALGGEQAARAAEALPIFRGHYAESASERTRAFPGVDGLLAELEAAGVRLGVLSNKPHDAVRPVLDQLYPARRFEAAWGHGPGGADSLKPEPADARRMLADFEAPPTQSAFVGDTSVDMQTGKAAGMLAVGVTWGFRERSELLEAGADRVVDSVAELRRTLLGEVDRGS